MKKTIIEEIMGRLVYKYPPQYLYQFKRDLEKLTIQSLDIVDNEIK